MPFVTMLRHTALQASLNSGVPQQEKKERVWAQLRKHTTKEPNIYIHILFYTSPGSAVALRHFFWQLWNTSRMICLSGKALQRNRCTIEGWTGCWKVVIPYQFIASPKCNSSPLKHDAWKTILSSWVSAYF